jgi:hypothetical protein
MNEKPDQEPKARPIHIRGRETSMGITQEVSLFLPMWRLGSIVGH